MKAVRCGTQSVVESICETSMFSVWSERLKAVMRGENRTDEMENEWGVKKAVDGTDKRSWKVGSKDKMIVVKVSF